MASPPSAAPFACFSHSPPIPRLTSLALSGSMASLPSPFPQYMGSPLRDSAISRVSVRVRSNRQGPMWSRLEIMGLGFNIECHAATHISRSVALSTGLWPGLHWTYRTYIRRSNLAGSRGEQREWMGNCTVRPFPDPA